MEPLHGGTPYGGRDQTIVTSVLLAKVTSRVSKPPRITSLAWNVRNSTTTTTTTDEKVADTDVNYNFTDQYGNPVKIQGLVAMGTVTQVPAATLQAEPMFYTSSI